MWKSMSVLTLALAVAAPLPGLAGDGVVALQSADPSCADDSGNRYVNCGNGTVTDNQTGLVWLRDASCLRRCSGGGRSQCSVDGDCPPNETCDRLLADWFTALEFVAGLSDLPDTSDAAAHDCGLSDGSSPGEWRLPSVAEWEAMVAEAAALGCSPTITNNQGDGCWAQPIVCSFLGGTCSFTEVTSGLYWSSTFDVFDFATAWNVALVDGLVGGSSKSSGGYVWPVRGGQ